MSEDKQLGLCLLGLTVVLVAGLLIWRSINNSDVEEALPPSVKQSVWFDEHGIVRSDASLLSEQAPQPALAEGRVAEPVTELVLAGESEAPAAAVAPVSALAPASVTAPKSPKSKKGKPDYIVQLASFSQVENADALAKRVAAAAPLVEVVTQARAAGSLSVVRVPVYGSRAAAENISGTLQAKFGLAPLVISNQ